MPYISPSAFSPSSSRDREKHKRLYETEKSGRSSFFFIFPGSHSTRRDSFSSSSSSLGLESRSTSLIISVLLSTFPTFPGTAHNDLFRGCTRNPRSVSPTCDSALRQKSQTDGLKPFFFSVPFFFMKREANKSPQSFIVIAWICVADFGIKMISEIKNDVIP